ncbi:MAG TPA: site-specific DNA-methyltransferase, partial [Alloiococcus sp.]|nr:site-specific DNA-methyltransferase [Alloiococcus sp.]
FTIDIAGNIVMQTNKLIELFEADEYWQDSYTKYSKKIGLTAGGKFIDESTDVFLDFPYKDTVLKASMSKEDTDKDDLRPDEPFLNEVIAKEEIDVLLDKKILVNAKKYDENGVHDVESFSENDNLIMKGNNLLALHTLKERYAGKVKMIYIDPPYNTGGDSFNYNDSFNHSSWLTFIKSRLEIAHNLLSDDGVIFISLDDKESHYCKVLVDEIFGRENFIADICHKSRASVSNDKIISSSHNHLLMFAKNERFIFKNKSEYGIDPDLTGFNELDENGEYRLVPVDGPGGAKKGNPYFKILGVEGFWRFSKDTMLNMYEKGRIVKKGNSIYQKYYKHDAQKKRKTITTWWDDGFLTSTATSELKKLFNGESVFSNPKNEQLLKRMIEFTTKKNDIVLDFFMGSATTQAVAHKMNRRYIGIEQMDYINTVSVPRLQKVIKGEQGGVSKDVEWQGGGSFVYVELMEKNRGFLKSIQHAKTLTELYNVFEFMLEEAEIDFRVDLEKAESELEGKSLNEQKKCLIKIIDKNQLYYNYSEIDDENVRDLIEDNDYAFNKSFYEGGE